MEQTNILQVKKGDVLFFQGDEEYILYKVLSGEIVLYINYGKKEERELARMKKDDCFGEMAILEHKPRTATAVAGEDCILMSYPEEHMGYFIAQNPVFALNIMKGLSSKLRNANKEINDMQELLVMANKRIPNTAIDRYIRNHTEPDANGVPRFTIKI